MKKMRAIMLVVIAAALGLAAAPARADGLDYACLHQCVGNGGSGQNCLQQCSYAAAPQAAVPVAPLPPAPAGVGSAELEAHNAVTAPKPTDAAAVQKQALQQAIARQEAAGMPPAAAPPPGDIDYACRRACVSNGTAFDLCEQRCAKPQCAPGQGVCHQLGVLNGAPVAGMGSSGSANAGQARGALVPAPIPAPEKYTGP